MDIERAQPKPTFVWQAILIVLPVVVLAAFGLFSLRQDKTLAQLEATERAQHIADDLVPRIWQELIADATNRPGNISFEVDAAGQLVFPPPFAPVPVPKPFELTVLNSEQLRFWQMLQGTDATPQNAEVLVQACEALVDSDPPENFAAAANYRLGLLLAGQGKLGDAAEKFELVAEDYPDSVGETGLPLQSLAQLKLLEVLPHESISRPYVARRSGKRVARPQRVSTRNSIPSATVTLEHFVSLDLVCSNLIYRPTPLSSHLLHKLQELAWSTIVPGTVLAAGATIRATADPAKGPLLQKLAPSEIVQKWQRVWDEHEMSRALYSAARRSFRTNASFAPRMFWFDALEDSRGSSDSADQKWLAVRFDSVNGGQTFVCHPEAEVRAGLNQLLNGSPAIPEYFGIGVDLAGRNLAATAFDLRLWHYLHYGGKGGGERKEFLTQLDPKVFKLATEVLASSARTEAGMELLRIKVYLTSPTALFERQRERTFWFGGLIAFSIAAALIGLAAAWGAFNRQQQLSDMKSNFVSSVSHELRAPIASVRLMAESLERGKISEPVKQNEYFRFIVQECRRLSSLIENVLDFSRIEQGRKQYEFEPTNVTALVEQTVKLMEPCAAEKGVRLELETSNIEHRTSNIERSVDGRAIQQALVNLIDNAIKHSPKGETVTVGIKRSSAEGQVSGGPKSAAANHGPDSLPLDATRNTQPASRLTPDTPHLTLFVADRGPGIPASEREKIFERFHRLGSELRRETQGVGIGLSIVKHIVAAHGGRVRVESEVGKGSCFTIELPN